MQSGDADLPAHDEIVRDLKLLRERGLIRLRGLDLPALYRATVLTGLSTGDGPDPPQAEQLLRRAVKALGDEEPGLATQYLFGLVQGTVGRRPTDLRERAAQVYGRLSAETFRKDAEKRLIERVAEEILRLCITTGLPDAPGLPDGPALSGGPAVRPRPDLGPLPPRGPSRSPGRPVDHPGPDRGLRQHLREALQHVLTMDDGPGAADGGVYRPARYGPFAMPCGQSSAEVWVRLGAIQEVSGVDVVVSSENVYLDPSRPFTSTLSGQLRSAAAVRDRAGSVIHDVVWVELSTWIKAHSAPGRPIEPGLVVPTSSGSLAERGMRRVYHAAVATPQPGRHQYQVSVSGVISAVHNCFSLARQERGDYEPPLRSMSFPLFGAGSGGLDPVVSFSWIWPVIRSELTADPTWEVHLTTWRPAETATVLRGLHRSLDDVV